MVPLLNDPAAKGREAAYTVVIRRGQLGRSIRTADWRYARWPGNAEELYHLKNDPAEETNLAATAENRKQLRLMRVMLDRAQTEAAAKRN